MDSKAAVTGGALRAARAALFTALCLTLSAGAHVLLSARPLPLTTVAVLAAGVYAVAFALAGLREWGYWAIAGLLVPLELTADTVFTTGQHACYGQAGGPVAGPLRSMGVDLLCGGGQFGTPLARATAHGDGAALVSGATMPWLLLAAHVLAGLAAAAWLRRGEAALGRLLRAVVAYAFRPLLLAVAVVPASRTPVRGVRPGAGPRVGRGRVLLLYAVVRRGPPYALAA